MEPYDDDDDDGYNGDDDDFPDEKIIFLGPRAWGPWPGGPGRARGPWPVTWDPLGPGPVAHFWATPGSRIPIVAEHPGGGTENQTIQKLDFD